MSKKSIFIRSILFIVIFIGVFAYGINYFNKNYIYNNKIGENISIENIDISSLTKEEALKKLQEEIKLNDINLVYNDTKYKISPSDIDLNYNLENLVNKAYNYNKKNEYFKNLEIFFELKKTPKNFNIVPSYDEAKLSNQIEKISNSINIKPVDATILIDDNGGITKTPSKEGIELDIVKAKEDIYSVIKSKNHTDIKLNIEVVKPEVSTADVESINSLLAEYTTSFSPNNTNRVTNIYLSAQKTSDVLLMPGEEFSYNDLTGKRIASNGYKDAPVIINGKLEQDVGGGVCQVSSTLFNSVMYSGLDITSRRNHSLKSSYVPIGQDAMVTDGGSDFRFKNPYNHPIYIKNVLSNGTITSRIYGNNQDMKKINIRVEKFKENGLDAAKTYVEYLDGYGNIVETKYIGKSVYKNPKK